MCRLPAAGAGAVAPEFQLVNESTVSGYLNFMTGVVANGMNTSDIKATYSNELALANDAAALVQQPTCCCAPGNCHLHRKG